MAQLYKITLAGNELLALLSSQEASALRAFLRDNAGKLPYHVDYAACSATGTIEVILDRCAQIIAKQKC